MKKTYVSPVTNCTATRVRYEMMSYSNDGLTDAGTNPNEEGYNDDDYAKSIWDDTCGDGFNW